MKRNIEPTRFEPEWLENCTIERYLGQRGTAKNKIVTFDLFDNVTKIKEVGSNIVHAMAINFRTNIPVVLILKKTKCEVKN